MDSRPVHVRVDRRDGGYGIFKVSQNVSPWLLVWLRSDTLGNPPGADPHAGWCGREGDQKPLPIPTRRSPVL